MITDTAERIVFLGAAIDAAEPGSADWFMLIEIFTRELKAHVAAAELAVAEPATEARH